MRKLIFLCCCLFLLFTIQAQEQYVDLPFRTIKLTPSALIMGSVSLHGEYNLKNRHSITVKIGIPVDARHNVHFNDRNAAFKMSGTSFLVGYRIYLSEKNIAGFYTEPFFKYLKHRSHGLGTLVGEADFYEFTNNFEGTAVGGVLGFQVLKKKIVLDIFAGPEINSAVNSFIAAETREAETWNDAKAGNIEKDTRAFINRFPFLKNRSDVTSDKEARRVSAYFLGALPGLRAGISIGLAF